MRVNKRKIRHLTGDLWNHDRWKEWKQRRTQGWNKEQEFSTFWFRQVFWSVRFTAQSRGEKFAESGAPPPHVCGLPLSAFPTRAGHLLQVMSPHWNFTILQIHGPHHSPPLVLSILQVWSLYNDSTHHYGIKQRVFLSWTSSVLHLFPQSPVPNPWPLWPFSVSVVLPFPECHIVGLLLYVAFSDWLISLVICILVSSKSFYVSSALNM